MTNKILSQFLNIKPPSVSEMVGRLEKAGYVETKPYKGVRLTEDGLTHTLDIIKETSTIRIIFNRNIEI